MVSLALGDQMIASYSPPLSCHVKGLPANPERPAPPGLSPAMCIAVNFDGKCTTFLCYAANTAGADPANWYESKNVEF